MGTPATATDKTDSYAVWVEVSLKLMIFGTDVDRPVYLTDLNPSGQHKCSLQYLLIEAMFLFYDKRII